MEGKKQMIDALGAISRNVVALCLVSVAVGIMLPVALPGPYWALIAIGFLAASSVVPWMMARAAKARGKGTQ